MREGNIAITTLASSGLTERISEMKPQGVCIVGKTETENIGIEKVIRNVISNPTIKYLIVVGLESKGHETGQTIISLSENGIDEEYRIIGSQGKKPILSNILKKEVETFRRQVEIVDMVGCEDISEIINKIDELNKKMKMRTTKITINKIKIPPKIKLPQLEVVQVKEKDPNKVKLDKAGYFVILPCEDRDIIRVEHYSYENKLLRIIEGRDSRSIYWTIIENGWLTELSHAAYLGKELTKAELSMRYKFKYIQDKG